MLWRQRDLYENCEIKLCLVGAEWSGEREGVRSENCAICELISILASAHLGPAWNARWTWNVGCGIRGMIFLLGSTYQIAL